MDLSMNMEEIEKYMNWKKPEPKGNNNNLEGANPSSQHLPSSSVLQPAVQPVKMQVEPSAKSEEPSPVSKMRLNDK